MAIRPIDMQLVVPKTIDYANKQQGEMNKQTSDQHMYAQVAAKNTEQKQAMVIQTNKSNESNNSVNKDGHNKQENKKGKKKNNSEKAASTKKEAKTGLFDVKV